MPKSFKDRLAALEELEAAQQAERDRLDAPLTDDECDMLEDQVALQNVAINAAGDAVRCWRTGCPDYTARYDCVLVKCNRDAEARAILLYLMEEWRCRRLASG
jgi:hypothetical protein